MRENQRPSNKSEDEIPGRRESLSKYRKGGEEYVSQRSECVILTCRGFKAENCGTTDWKYQFMPDYGEI